MAFRRRERKVVTLEFIDADEKKLVYEVPYSKELGEKLTKIGEDIDTENSTEEEQIQFLIKAYDAMLGDGAMKVIRERVFEGDELLLTDLLDIGNYIIQEVEKMNEKIVADYGQNFDEEKMAELFAKGVENSERDRKQFSIEEVQRILNDNKHQLSN